MEVKAYRRSVQYHETDKMGITHHSNYIKWMEEARVDYLDQIGWSYTKLEDMGAISPVVGVEINYKKPTTFGDIVLVDVKVVEYGGVKIIFQYNMTKEDGTVVATAKSTHCFINKDGRVISVASKFPELDFTIKSLLN